MAIPVSVSWADEPEPIRLCTDDNFFAPLTFVFEGKAAGTHVALTREAIKRTGRSVDVKALPWTRCLNAAKRGTYDGVVSASFREDRTEDFLYPDGAAEVSDDAAYLSRARDVVIVRAGTAYEGDGSRFSLPQPVGVPLGYNFSDLLRERDTVVQSAKSIESLFKMLERGRVASVVVMSEVAEIYLQEPAFKERLRVLPTADHQASYYLMFSRKGTVGQTEAEAIWQQLLGVRSDTASLTQIRTQVEQQLKQLLASPELE